MTHAIKPLTAEAFAAFGDVIEANNDASHFAINYGLTTRFHNLAKVDTEQNNGQIGISIFRSTPMPLPLQLKIMERHPLSSQAFYPLNNRPYLVVVAPAGEFNPEAVQIFLAQANQGVNYHAGTWHHFSLALNEISDFLVVDRIGEGPNCDEIELQVPITISAEDLPF